jgi:hypothetical protein
VNQIRKQREDSADAIVAEVNERFDLDLTRFALDTGAIFARDERGFAYVIVVSLGNHVRGVIRQTRRGARYSYLHNGQVGNLGKQWLGPWKEGSFVVEGARV